MIFIFRATCLSFLLNTFLVNFHALNNDSVYVVARGTKTKRAIIAEEFNLSNKEITHIGVGIKDGKTNQLEIFNVDIIPGNALESESFASFISSKDIFYYGIWELNVGKRDVRKLRILLSQMKKQSIMFDHSFTLKNGRSNLYCSEFVWEVLKKTYSKAKVIKPVTKRLTDPSMRKILHRDTLIYIPPDFFLAIKGIIKVEEKIFQ